MDTQPKTRQEKKGGKKNKDKSIYSAKHVRMQQAIRENGTASSTLKTPPTSETPSSSKK